MVAAASSRKEFSLEENVYSNHPDWKRDWQAQAEKPVLCTGLKKTRPPAPSRPAKPRYSRMAARGLPLLPDGWGSPSQHLVVEGVRFAYG
ncbi:hypothetical protein MPNT_280029 [Candidatus Methylacidithermus pantelleriae]|uniref:Uncharacterized protein n=1 Tax=Candidatus Methylacidithermus pantelleriae TaxID=2744239 RepID=A0A8J2BQA3_9BACT|nr:hypothetical protein MPNT_280029 [Candidatus Methylacidithermus pantelleriae]